jgi:hypothetical protein
MDKANKFIDIKRDKVFSKYYEKIIFANFNSNSIFQAFLEDILPKIPEKKPNEKETLYCRIYKSLKRWKSYIT